MMVSICMYVCMYKIDYCEKRVCAHITHEFMIILAKPRDNWECERIRYRLPNLYHACTHGFQHVATSGNKKCGYFSPGGTKSVGCVPL